jgi:ABC-type phosphate transport system auxiliary subunit
MFIRNARPSMLVILGLLLLLAWHARHLLVPATVAAVPWIIAQPAALLLLLLGALWWRAKHPTTQVRNR